MVIKSFGVRMLKAKTEQMFGSLKTPKSSVLGSQHAKLGDRLRVRTTPCTAGEDLGSNPSPSCSPAA